MQKFKAKIDIIGVNPFVFVPTRVLEKIFAQANKEKGAIPIRGTVNNAPYRQTLVKYAGHWRLYINTSMLRESPKRIGEEIEVTVEFDPKDRTIKMPSAFVGALAKHTEARIVFEGLSESRKREIVRYLARLKSQTSLEKNTRRAIRFLLGEERFVGRERP